ncbi:MAG: hypothetical protein R2831_03745 [Chitinophagaceae bacterium]
MKLTHLLPILLFAKLHFACKKKTISKPDLPPATQTGANTFGCYIDGKAFFASGSLPGIGLNLGTGSYAIFSIRNDSFPKDTSIEIDTRNDDYQDLVLEIRFTEKMVYYDVGNSKVELNCRFYKGDDYFYTDSTHKINLHVTLFLYNSYFSGNIKDDIFAGRFSGTLVNNKGIEIALTDGRFDLSRR